MNAEGRQPLVNYHSHTWRCQHAGGTEEEFVLQAIETGFSVFGFADHTPWPYESDYVSNMRMRLDQFPDYVCTVRALGKKYAGRIFIPLGLECEAFPDYFGWLADTKAQHLDYVIMGNHFDRTDDGDRSALSDAGGFYFGRCVEPRQIRRYAERTIAGMETGLFDYVAHPDLYCRGYHVFDAECAAVARDLCAASRALNVPLEYNLLGVQVHDKDVTAGGLGYPCEGFWEVAAQCGVKAILGLDAHQIEQITRRDLFDNARAYLTGLGIEILPCLPGLEPPAHEDTGGTV